MKARQVSGTVVFQVILSQLVLLSDVCLYVFFTGWGAAVKLVGSTSRTKFDTIRINKVLLWSNSVPDCKSTKALSFVMVANRNPDPEVMTCSHQTRCIWFWKHMVPLVRLRLTLFYSADLLVCGWKFAYPLVLECRGCDALLHGATSQKTGIFKFTAVIALSLKLCARYIINIGHEDFAVIFHMCVLRRGGGGAGSGRLFWA
jgi:hypothetical protein